MVQWQDLPEVEMGSNGLRVISNSVARPAVEEKSSCVPIPVSPLLHSDGPLAGGLGW